MSRKHTSNPGPSTTSGSAVGALTPAPTSSTPRPGPGLSPAMGIDLPTTQSSQGRAAAPRQTPGPTVEEVRKRAFELYLARAGRSGTPEGDWLQAERELRARAARS